MDIFTRRLVMGAAGAAGGDKTYVNDVYQSMIRLGTWSGLIRDSSSHIVDAEKELQENYKEIYDTIQKVLSVRTESMDTTVDEVLLGIMNKKYVIANKISDLIKKNKNWMSEFELD